MNIKRKVPLIIGIVALVIGGVFVLNYFGIINVPIPGFTFSTITPTGRTIGIAVTNTRIQYPLTLSAVGAGYTYKWSSAIKNTGSAAWNTGWVNIRLGINGATAVQVTCASNPASCPDGKVGGSFWVESCSGQTDVIACREDIASASTWNFKWSADGTTWYACTGGTYPGSTKAGGYLNKVCSIDLGAVAAGTTKNIYWQLTVPTTYTSGAYPFIIQTMGWADATYAVAGARDILTIGSIAGDVTLVLMGFVSIIVGAASTIYAFI